MAHVPDVSLEKCRAFLFLGGIMSVANLTKKKMLIINPSNMVILIMHLLLPSTAIDIRGVGRIRR